MKKSFFHSISLIRLDTFHAEFLPDKELKSLWKACILVFCLSHGQSAVECSFHTDGYTVENQSELSFIGFTNDT